MFLLASALHDYPVYALLALSFFISYRILDFPDLSMDSAFALGMATLAQVIHRDFFGLASTLAVPLSLVTGFLVGTALALLHGLRQLSIAKLLAGLIISFCLYTVAFRFNVYATTQGLYTKPHWFNLLRKRTSDPEIFPWATFSVSILVVTTAFVIVALVLRSNLGLRLRVAGYRPAILIETGRDPLLYMAFGLGLAGSLSALSGWLRASNDNYTDINTFGTFLYALASLLLGERLRVLTRRWSAHGTDGLLSQLLAPLVGAFFMSLLVQLSVWFLADVMKVYLSSDIRLVVGLAVLLSAARTDEPFGRSGLAG